MESVNEEYPLLNSNFPGFISCHQCLLWYYSPDEKPGGATDILEGICTDVNMIIDRDSAELFENFNASYFEFVWLKYLQDKKWIKK